MSNEQGAGIMAAGAGAQIAILTNAIKACGTLVRIEPDEFLRLLARQDSPLIVHALGGFLITNYQYLTSYKGLAFYCKSPKPLPLPEHAELISARKMTIPEL